MTNLAQRTNAGNAAPPMATIRQRSDDDVRTKVCAPAPAQNQPRARFSVRQARTSDPRPQRAPFAARVMGFDSLSSLNIFMRAAETCSFTEAGRQLGLSSSAVGKSVARLEQRLGVELLHRNTRCVALTHEGKTFLESCRRIFSELQSAENVLAQTKGAPKGRLRVSMPLNGTLMVPRLGDFVRAYPDIDLDIEFTDSLVDVVDGGYDVVLRSGEVIDSRLKSRRLGTYQFEIVGSPGYFARAGVPRKPEDLLQHACLHRKHPTTGKIHLWPFAPSPPINDLVLPTTATASTLDALVHLAVSGVGIACVPNFCAQAQISDGSLVHVLKEYIDHFEVVRAIWPSSRYESPKLRAFIEFLAGNLLLASTSRLT
jgi:DNA-binding transcriptional LysR family regulator